VLTQRHLALIRAALQFFDDELVPHGLDGIRPYLDSALDENATSREIQQLRSFLRNVELRYGRFNRRTGDMIEVQCDELIESTNASIKDSSQAAVVILLR
jgi:cytochrome c biogenesis protein ResB